MVKQQFENLKMTRPMKRFCLLLAGWCCLVFGIIGLFLPVLQGILFIFIGLTILSAEYAWPAKVLTALRARFPGLDRAARKVKARAKAWLRRDSKPQKHV